METNTNRLGEKVSVIHGRNNCTNNLHCFRRNDGNLITRERPRTCLRCLSKHYLCFIGKRELWLWSDGLNDDLLRGRRCGGDGGGRCRNWWMLSSVVERSSLHHQPSFLPQQLYESTWPRSSSTCSSSES